MIIELADCTNTLMREISMKDFKQKNIAETYAFAIASTEPTDWKAVNDAIVKRWSKSGLNRIKQTAWKKIRLDVRQLEEEE